MRAFQPPPDKSITLRALLLGAIAEGRTTIENPLLCDDTRAAMGCLRALGVRLEAREGRIVVEGRGLRGLRPSRRPLDARESGTAARLLAGLLAGQAFPSTITGAASLRRRPMDRVARPLARMGARIRTRRGGLPIAIEPSALSGIEYAMPMASAQVKSALLLAGLYADGLTAVREPGLSRDHTERLLAHFGGKLSRRGGAVTLVPGELRAKNLTVPGDPSSSAPFLVAALSSRAGLCIQDVGLNPTRLGLVRTLRRMGADIEVTRAGGSFEPVGDILARPSGLRAVVIGAGEVPAMIDELPLLMVAASAARGKTVIRGAGELRHKESDRIAASIALLKALGGRAASRGGDLEILGPCPFAGARVDAFHDHRIAMAAAAAGVRAAGKVTVRDPGCVKKSYPGFFEDFARLFG